MGKLSGELPGCLKQSLSHCNDACNLLAYSQRTRVREHCITELACMSVLLRLDFLYLPFSFGQRTAVSVSI